MTAPRHGDQIHIAARFISRPALPTTEVTVRINTAAGTVDVKVLQSAILTTQGSPIEWSPPCTAMFPVEGEGFYLRCESSEHMGGSHHHWAKFSPSDVHWTDDHPNAVRIQG